MIKRKGSPKSINDEKRICNANQLNYICKIGLFTTEPNQISTKTLPSIQATAASLTSELSTTDKAETSTPEMVTFKTSIVKQTSQDNAPSSNEYTESSVTESVDPLNTQQVIQITTKNVKPITSDLVDSSTTNTLDLSTKGNVSPTTSEMVEMSTVKNADSFTTKIVTSTTSVTDTIHIPTTMLVISSESEIQPKTETDTIDSSTTMVRSSILETVDTNNPVKKCNFFDVRAEYTEDVDWFCGKCIFFWE